MAYEGLTFDLTPSDAIDLRFTEDGEAAILTPTRNFNEPAIDTLRKQLEAINKQSENGVSNSIIDLSKVETLTTVGLKALVNFT